MCRLLAYVSTSPRTLVQMLGEDGLQEFTELSCLHGDGWGAARIDDSGISVETVPAAARTSEEFSAMAHGSPADRCLVHLRWATLGLPVTAANTHPFTDGAVAFAHNGSIEPVLALEELIDPDRRSQLHGDTDSERYFQALLSRIPVEDPSIDDIVTAYADTLSSITSSFTYSSLNSVLLTPDHLVVACCFDTVAEATMGEPDYFRLHYVVTDESVLVSSSGWGTGWAIVPNDHLMVINRTTLATSLHALASSAGRSDPETGAPAA